MRYITPIRLPVFPRQSDNSIQIFDTSGIERYKQESSICYKWVMSGSYTLLKQRFELSNADIDSPKEAVKQGNIDGVQQALNNAMKCRNILLFIIFDKLSITYVKNG